MTSISDKSSVVGVPERDLDQAGTAKWYADNGIDKTLGDRFSAISLSTANQIPVSPGPTQAQRAFFDSLTPEQLKTTAFASIGNNSKGLLFTWQQVKDYVYTLGDLLNRIDFLGTGGGGQAAGAPPGGSTASAAQIETSYVQTLIDGLAADRPGSLAQAQGYLTKASGPADTITLSASAVQRLVQADEADKQAHPFGYWEAAIAPPTATVTQLAVDAQAARVDVQA